MEKSNSKAVKMLCYSVIVKIQVSERHRPKIGHKKVLVVEVSPKVSEKKKKMPRGVGPLLVGIQKRPCSFGSGSGSSSSSSVKDMTRAAVPNAGYRMSNGNGAAEERPEGGR